MNPFFNLFEPGLKQMAMEEIKSTTLEEALADIERTAKPNLDYHLRNSSQVGILNRLQSADANGNQTISVANFDKAIEEIKKDVCDENYIYGVNGWIELTNLPTAETSWKVMMACNMCVGLVGLALLISDKLARIKAEAKSKYAPQAGTIVVPAAKWNEWKVLVARIGSAMTVKQRGCNGMIHASKDEK